MRFQVNIISKEVKAAAIVAENLFHPCSEMMDELRVKDDFKYNSGTGIEVVSKISGFNKTIQVFSYKPWYAYSKAIGYSDSKGIHINLRKLGSLSHADIVGWLVHEASHQVGFTHSSNYPSEFKNNFSVPYFLSSNVERWL